MTDTERLLHSPACDRGIYGVEDAFWRGDGDNLADRLLGEGWQIIRWVAHYYWVLELDGRHISYTEGDVSFSLNESCGQ